MAPCPQHSDYGSVISWFSWIELCIEMSTVVVAAAAEAPFDDYHDYIPCPFQSRLSLINPSDSTGLSMRQVSLFVVLHRIQLLNNNRFVLWEKQKKKKKLGKG